MSEFILGLDLGQASDYTALSIIEPVKVPVGETSVEIEHIPAPKLLFPLADSGGPLQHLPTAYTGRHVRQQTEKHYHLRHPERFKLGTPYPEIVRHVQALMQTEPLKGHITCVINATGVGALCSTCSPRPAWLPYTASPSTAGIP